MLKKYDLYLEKGAYGFFWMCETDGNRMLNRAFGCAREPDDWIHEVDLSSFTEEGYKDKFMLPREFLS